MHYPIRRLCRCVATAAIFALPAAASHANLLDFEDPDLTGLYFAGESFEHAGFKLTQGRDSAMVDTWYALGSPPAPTNNVSQFYTSLNDGFLTIASSNGVGFSLQGFSAAYVPMLGGELDPLDISLVVLGKTIDGYSFSTTFSLGDTTSGDEAYPFLSFSNPKQFSIFSNLSSVQFFTCASSAGGRLCDTPTQNMGQFALDDIRVTPVPEPSTLLLMAAGIAAVLGLRRQRAA